MGSSTVISLERQSARIVYGTVRAGAVAVSDALVIPSEQLDGFLAKESRREFIVVNNFSEPFQDVISVPAAKKKLLDGIIEIEVRKRSGFTDFSFVYSVIGTRSTEQGKKTDVFVFAVRGDEVRAVIDRFASRGKTVTALYADAFLLARASAVDGEDVLCVSSSGDKKVFSLVKDGVLQFTREVLSNSAELSDFDMQNLDMTINYCRQSLRVMPSVVMFAGRLGQSDRAASVRGSSTACLVPKISSSRMAREALADFTVPALALSAAPAFDICPRPYRAEKLKTRLLRYSSISFAALSVFLAVMTYSALRDAGAARSGLRASLAGLPETGPVVAAYGARVAEMERYSPFIELINRAAASPDPAALMASLSRLDTGRISLGLINITPSDGGLRLRLEGDVRATSYASTQSHFESFVASFARIEGARVAEQRLMLKNRSFLLEVDYR